MKEGQGTGKHSVVVWITGGVLAGCALLFCAAMGSPLPTLHKLMALDILPPVWMVSLLWLVGLFMVGSAAADALTCPRGGGGVEACAWQGGAWLALSLAFTVAWYALLFARFSLLASWICLLLAVGCALLGTLALWQTHWMNGIRFGGYALWLALVCGAQMVVMLRL